MSARPRRLSYKTQARLRLQPAFGVPSPSTKVSKTGCISRPGTRECARGNQVGSIGVRRQEVGEQDWQNASQACKLGPFARCFCSRRMKASVFVDLTSTVTPASVPALGCERCPAVTHKTRTKPSPHPGQHGNRCSTGGPQGTGKWVQRESSPPPNTPCIPTPACPFCRPHPEPLPPWLARRRAAFPSQE